MTWPGWLYQAWASRDRICIWAHFAAQPRSGKHENAHNAWSSKWPQPQVQGQSFFHMLTKHYIAMEESVSVSRELLHVDSVIIRSYLRERVALARAIIGTTRPEPSSP